MDPRLATGPRAPFLDDLLAYTCEDDWRALLHVGDRVEVTGKEWDDALVVDVVDGLGVVEVEVDGVVQRVTLTDDDYPHIVASPHAEAIWERHQQGLAPDGVAWADDALDESLSTRLRALFDALCERPADYHPGSDGTVRDLVHPSLYPFIDGLSERIAGRPAPSSDPPAIDRWGRPYEGSRYQWLPTDVAVDDQGVASFLGPLNHLGDDAPEGASELLAELLTRTLPLLESVVGYADAFDPWDEREDDCEADLPEPPAALPPAEPAAPASLRGRRLQVIPKLVQYELVDEASSGSVWHVEGMSHEHIVATVVTVVERDPGLDGGTLRFRRGYTREEAGQLFWNVAQVRPVVVDEMVDQGLLPVGSIDTPSGRMLAFPNSHVHKLTPMTSADGSPVRRRVVVFWLVDPAVRIPSTSDVKPLQATMSLAEARAHRLELMEERRRHKQSHNNREISLCEH